MCCPCTDRNKSKDDKKENMNTVKKVNKKTFDLNLSYNRKVSLVYPPFPPPATPFSFYYFQFAGEVYGGTATKWKGALQLPPRRLRAARNEGEFVVR
jgi:hypothetical protein